MSPLPLTRDDSATIEAYVRDEYPWYDGPVVVPLYHLARLCNDTAAYITEQAIAKAQLCSRRPLQESQPMPHPSEFPRWAVRLRVIVDLSAEDAANCQFASQWDVYDHDEVEEGHVRVRADTEVVARAETRAAVIATVTENPEEFAPGLFHCNTQGEYTARYWVDGALPDDVTRIMD